MKLALTLGALLLSATPLAYSAPAVYVVRDNSTTSLMDDATAIAMVRQSMPKALSKLYPISRWGFVTEVEGGFDDAKVCVITARTMLLPRSATGALVFKPQKTTTTFGSKANADRDQCKALAKSKLAESIEAMRFGLLGS